MNDILFEVLKLVVMVTVLVLARYVIPWAKEKVGADQVAVIEKWAKYAVLKAQQVLWAESGEEKKAYVTEFLKKILMAKKYCFVR